jgi:hypothetical protein
MNDTMDISISERSFKTASRLNYFQILNRLLVSPGQFFDHDIQGIRLGRALWLLVVSSLVFTLARVSLLHPSSLVMSVIYFLNALIMPSISALMGYVIVKKGYRRSIGFSTLFTIYALASGFTLLMAWMPLFLFITEPWKWFLIGLGLVKRCGLNRRQSLLVVSLTILLVVLGFWLLNEAVLLFR